MKRAYLYIVILALVALPARTLAAEALLTVTPVSAGVGDTIAVTVSIDTKNQLNTFAGVLSYDPSVLTPISVSDGNSISNIWLSRPTPGATSTPFIGFAAGGFVGTGELFTEKFVVQKEGTTDLALSNVQLLRNDGQGTEEPVYTTPLSISLSANSSGSYEEPKDDTPPELFTVSLGTASDVYDGNAYVAFAPVDKGSGIDRVEAVETRWPFGTPKLVTTNSPYQIKDRYLTSRIVVRAYDRAGNERTVVFPRTRLFRPYELKILGTLGVAFLIWLFLYLRKRSRA